MSPLTFVLKGCVWMAGIGDRVFELIKGTVEAQGVTLWDVRFVKEGASHYLRIFIDKPEGVDINDCTNVSHAIDPIIDEADPIDTSYFLEVSSPGLERELTREEHYGLMMGKTVKIRLFKAIDSKKEFVGVLKDYNGDITIQSEGTDITFKKGTVAKTSLAEI